MRLSFVFIIFLLVLSPVSAYYKVTEQHEVEAPYHSPIIFIPGIMGSILQDQSQPSLVGEMWVGSPFVDRSPLDFNKKGKPTTKSIKPLASIRRKYGGPVYVHFFNWMDDKMPYTLNGEDEQQGVGRVYYDHPYDFRYDNRLHVENSHKVGNGISLRYHVNKVLKETRSDKVILIAHSMGGYQAKLFADKYPEKVRAIIFLSSPHHGSPKAYQSFTKGYNFGVPFITDATVFSMGMNWPGPYQLMPDYDFVYMGGKLLSREESYFGNWIPEQQLAWLQAKIHDPNGLGDDKEAEKRLNSVIKDFDVELGLPSHSVVRDSLKFKEELADIELEDHIRVEIINGNWQETTQSFTAHIEDSAQIKYLKDVDYSAGTPSQFGPGDSIKRTYDSIPSPYLVLILKATDNDDGDGTVPTAGLIWPEGSEKEPYLVNTDHGKVPGNADAQLLMESIIEEINHDRRDMGWVDDITRRAKSEIRRLKEKMQDADDSAEHFASQIAKSEEDAENEEIDEEIRDDIKDAMGEWEHDLKGRAGFLVMNRFIEGKKNYINLIVPGLGEYQDQDDFHAYVILDSYNVVDAGIGHLTSSTHTVTMEPFAFKKVLWGQMRLSQAYKQGHVKVSGSFMATVAQAITSLVRRFLGDAREEVEEEKERLKKEQEAFEQHEENARRGHKLCRAATECYEIFKDPCSGSSVNTFTCESKEYTNYYGQQSSFRHCVKQTQSCGPKRTCVSNGVRGACRTIKEDKS